MVGRALRRQSYDLNEEDLLTVEYADVLGIPFDFTATPIVAPPRPPRKTVHVRAVRPERDHLEIRFPRVAGYSVELPGDGLTAEFNEDSVLELTPELVGATETRNSGIIGESVDLNLAHTTSRTSRYQTDSRRCHVNWAILDSDWEAELCRVVEEHPQVVAYVKNHNLGFEVPYQTRSRNRRYLPDFIVLLDDGRGEDDPLHLIVEVKGYRGEDAKDMKEAMETCWVPGVNRLGSYGRWGFVELRDVYTMRKDIETRSRIHEEFELQAGRFLHAARAEAAQNLMAAGGSMPDLEYIPRRKSPLPE